MSAKQTLERSEVEELVCNIPGGRAGELAFEQPWEIRAFALAVAAHNEGRFVWTDFQSALISSIKEWEDSVADLEDPSWSYYQHWVSALEEVLDQVDQESLTDRTNTVLATPANNGHHKAALDPIAIDPARR